MELPKKQLPRSLPRYYELVGTFSCDNSPFLGGTRGIVLLSSWVWKNVNGWALEIGISCTYSNPIVTGGRKHTHTYSSVVFHTDLQKNTIVTCILTAQNHIMSNMQDCLLQLMQLIQYCHVSSFFHCYHQSIYWRSFSPKSTLYGWL